MVTVRSRAQLKSLLAGATALLLLVGAGSTLGAGAASADSAPVDPASPATPTTVSADALPTVQMNGVAWSQVVLGNTVYVAGKFTSARPAGVAAGTQETARNNLLAYDITTGNLVAGWAPSLNAQALSITASPDGSRLYVGGDFTTVNGTTRNRVAALSPTTGALIAGFAPSVSSQVRAVAATNSTVYLGGNFATVGGVARARLAAVSASNGALLPWNPTLQPGPTDQNSDPNKTPAQNAATSTEVLALLVTGGGSQVVAAGRFDQLNNVKATGVGALDAATGATRPFAVNQQIHNQGINSAVYSLSTDGTSVYGTGYDFYGPGELEGAFSAAADGGAPNWFNSCLGDTYSAFPSKGALYQATHAHDCHGINGYPEQQPRVNKFASAVSLAATGTSTAAFGGQPSPTLLSWFPLFSAGTYTGQFQAGWTVTGNSDYVVFGGEFPRVNGTAQQGLVRFAVPTKAPNKVGPVYDAAMKPTPLAVSAGTVRLSWPTTWDYDNQTLTYDVYRSDKATTILGTVTAASQWWDRPTTGFIDRTATPGATYTYKVNVRDPFGNQYRSANSTAITVARDSAPAGLYADTVNADQPSHFWRLGEAAGATTSYDQAAFDDLALAPGVTLGASGALNGNADTAGTFSGDDSGRAATTSPVVGPQLFSLESWFQTTTTGGGKIVGFGNQPTGNSGSYDRHIYMDGSGRVTMGVYDGSLATVTSPNPLNDGAWHHVVGSYGNGVVTLYVDGQLIGTRGGVNGAQAYSGYWRIGGDSSWQGNNYFPGKIDEVAVYPKVLTAEQVRQHQAIGATGQRFNAPPTAAFTSSANGLLASFDGSTSSDTDGTVASYAWSFGDGTTGTGVNATHTYATAGSYRVTLTVTDNRGKTASVQHLIAVAATGQAGSAYSRAVLADDPTDYWRLGDTDGPMVDSAGTSDLTVNSGVTRGTAGAIASDSDAAARFDGSGGLAVTQTQIPGPGTFSLEAWFQTTSTSGGKIIGFGNATTGTSNNYDRHVYMSGDGTVWFGTYTGALNTVQTESGYNDGRWHHVVATISSAGMAIYVDGRPGSTSGNTGAQDYSGYWRVGGDSSWNGDPYFNGSIDDVAVYPVALTAAQAGRHYGLGNAAGNAAPTAAFISSVADLTASVDGSGSSDRDGRIASYAWDFGDGRTATGATPSHTYARAGTYTVTLTVTDDGGATGTVTHDVTVTAPPNGAPTASFTSTVRGLAVTVDGSASSDPDGTVASYDWDFGDGATATGATPPAHTYAAGGTYSVVLTVTDDAGSTGTKSQPVTVAPVANVAPTASFTSSVSDLTATFDATASTDSDGSVASYAWNFGDTTTGTGPQPAHTYAAAGTYTVVLTVTDNQGATGTMSRSITVKAPPTGPVAFASDDFNRTVSGGLGTATKGGAWTASYGPARQSVSAGLATLSLPAAGNQTGSYLGSVSQPSADVRTSVSLSGTPTGSGTTVWVVGRRVGTNQEYRVRLRYLTNGAVGVAMTRLSGSTTEVLIGAEVMLPGTYAVGTVLQVRLQVAAPVNGTTQLTGTAWRSGTTEPTTATLTRTDNTASLQASGGLGLTAYLSGSATSAVTVKFGPITATPVS